VENDVSSSSRASGAPKQKCTPAPNDTCGLGSRPTSRSSGRSNTAGSRFADPNSNPSSAPLGTAAPQISESSNTHRSNI
jgi:hypothetical protein